MFTSKPRIISTALISAALALAPASAPALAQTTDSATQIAGLTAQLQQLQQLLAQLQSQSGTSATVPVQVQGSAAGCPTPLPSQTLARGSRGTEVSALQAWLISGGYLAAGNATGYFGPLTEAAVQRFQASHGVVSSGSPSTTGYGVVGPRTRTAIASSCAAPAQNYSSQFTQTPVVVSAFSANPTQLTMGQQSVLNWTVQNAAGCVLSQQVPGEPSYVINANLPTTGALVLTPQKSTIYTMACTALGAQGVGVVRSIGLVVQ